MTDSDLEKWAIAYAELSGIVLDLNRPLGHGAERRSRLKAVGDRQETFLESEKLGYSASLPVPAVSLQPALSAGADDLITIPELIALNAFQGLVNALDVPARQAFTLEMVDDRDNFEQCHCAELVDGALRAPGGPQ
jgi:hypothetical protein